MEEYLKFIVQDIRGGVTIIFICSQQTSSQDWREDCGLLQVDYHLRVN